MAILLKGWILPIGGTSSGRVCACSLRSRLVQLKPSFFLFYLRHGPGYGILPLVFLSGCTESVWLSPCVCLFVWFYDNCVVVSLWLSSYLVIWQLCGCLLVVVFLWLYSCGCLLVVVFLWLSSCVVVFFWLSSCGCLLVVVFLWLFSCGCLSVVVFL